MQRCIKVIKPSKNNFQDINWKKLSLYGILVLAFILRLTSILIPNIGEWDERFHALVAKNLMRNPFRPSLITDGLCTLDPLDWSLCDIWFAKPPLALWSMMFSMEIFGVNEFGLRFPSLIFSMISVLLTYWLGKHLFNEKIGLVAALLYAINGMLLEVNIGRLAGDHVDTLFFMLFQLAVVALLLDERRMTVKKSVLIGAIIGLSFLTKWTASFFILIVVAMCGLIIWRNLQKVLIFTSLVIFTAVIVVLPWMWYIYHSFPVETATMVEGMFTPLTEVVQKHSGPWYYYINSMRININELVYLPLLFLIFMVYKKRSLNTLILFVWIMLPLLVLSYSATKREVYLLMSATPIFISIAYFLHVSMRLSKGSRWRPWIKFLYFLVIVAAIRYSIERIKPMQITFAKPQFRIEMETILKNSTSPSDSIILVNDPHYLEARFYYDMLGYRYLSTAKIDSLSAMGYTVFSFNKGAYHPY
ncbi:MAG: glycosyltransferase family 39 protein [Saprospiraceae bacterium]